MNTETRETLSKVPEVTLVFWIIKILATTLGETGGDVVSMSMNLGYLISTAIFALIFIVAVVIQVCAKRFHPVIYWTTIIATTTVGTTLADFADRSLGVGYAGGAASLFILLMASLFIWHHTLGSVAVDTVNSPKSEVFYWITIMFSQTLGTALGDWMADDAGLGYGGSAVVFGAMLGVIAAMTTLMEGSYANVHRGLHALSTTATEAYEAARESLPMAVTQTVAEQEDELVAAGHGDEPDRIAGGPPGAGAGHCAAVVDGDRGRHGLGRRRASVAAQSAHPAGAIHLSSA
jgi:uncharacterized membrane-anchored protein